MSEELVRAVLFGASQGCWDALDVGSGPGKFRPGFAKWFTLDAYHKVESNGHVTADLLVALPEFEAKSRDLVYALDVIEHLDKSSGYSMITLMERIARKRVLFFTPNGFREQVSENRWQVHRSGWTADDFRQLGYATGVVDFDYGRGLEPSSALWAIKEA